MAKFSIQDFDKQMEDIRKKHRGGANPFQGLRDSLKRRISGNKTSSSQIK